MNATSAGRGRRGERATGQADSAHMARHVPTRVLAEVEAKRSILKLYEDPEQSTALLTARAQRSVLAEVLHTWLFPTPLRSSTARRGSHKKPTHTPAPTTVRGALLAVQALTSVRK
ncbi:DUF6221 family protein [Streptomyces sp. NPDC056010]|uniref:DUF6221 family protein n=1 Tax=Streptomyces sp. NPDC056010 TaxID=3345679 RepID=UPI0035DDA52A